MLSIDKIYFMFYVIIVLACMNAGIVLAMEKFNVFFRIFKSRQPCYFCILFWASLIMSLYPLYGPHHYRDFWMCIPIGFGSAALGRALLTVI